MICILALLSFVSATLYADLYKVEETCAFESNEFLQSSPRIVASFKTACARLHSLTAYDNDGCKKGIVSEPGVCHVKCVPCKTQSDFCFDYVLLEQDLYQYLFCFELESLTKRLVCTVVWMLTRERPYE